jgi:general secretion pathway protein D
MMTMRRTAHRFVTACLLAACAGTLAPALAQNQPAKDGEPAKLAPNGRRVIDGPPTTLAFKNVTIEEIVPFIVQVTGKVVMPQQAVLSRRVTVLNDQPIPREEALDLVVLALQQNGTAVVETEKTITLRDIGEITRQDVPVLGPDTSTLDRTDLGMFVEKVYALRHNTAKKMGDVVKVGLPEFAKLTIDEESNQLTVMGNVALLQRIERLISSLDRPAAGALQTETFRLRYADATSVRNQINDLFGESSGAARATNNNDNRQQWRFGGGGGGGEQASAATSGEIRVSASTQQNSVTVVADPAVLQQIRMQIESEWDRPLAEEAVTPRIYDLKHTDPVKVAQLLTGLFGGTATTGTTGGGNNQQGNQNRQDQGAPTSGQGAGRLAGQFTFQAIPDASRLVVVAKSPDNLAVIDNIIEGIDQPQTVGLPEVIELKHASAEDLAEQVNALLAQDGTLAQIRRAEEGLSAGDSAGASPFATDTSAAGNTEEAATRENLSFWWQRSRTPTDRRNASNLIGQLRIVPVWRQNALMVVSPPEYRESILDLIAKLDKPGRQVLISAIVAEVSREDATSLGLRWSNQQITTTNPDNSVGVRLSSSGSEETFANSLFDTSVLTANADLNLLLQALNEKSDVSILSEPKIFTSDNQEAEFFDGQDIPFVTDTQTNSQGNLVQSFDYRAVGIQLRARPRITINGDVDLRVNLELSSIVPGETLFGGFVVDRRETTTHTIIQNKQTIVISGIVREEATNIVRKIPLLGDIPFLGELFKSRDVSRRNTELLVFITPIVVNNTSDNVPTNAPFIERLEAIRESVGESMGREKEDEKDKPVLTPVQPEGEAAPDPDEKPAEVAPS